jgi:hypothetical protein
MPIHWASLPRTKARAEPSWKAENARGPLHLSDLSDRGIPKASRIVVNVLTPSGDLSAGIQRRQLFKDMIPPSWSIGGGHWQSIGRSGQRPRPPPPALPVWTGRYCHCVGKLNSKQTGCGGINRTPASRFRPHSPIPTGERKLTN